MPKVKNEARVSHAMLVAYWEGRMTENALWYMRQVKDETLAALFSRGKELTGNYAGWSRRKVEENLPGNPIFKAIKFDRKKELKRVTELFSGVLTEALDEAGDLVLQSLGMVIGFNVNDPEVGSWLGSRLYAFSRQITGTTFDEVEAIMRVGFKEGLPLPTIAESLRNKFASWERYRAPLIARTEAVSALNNGSYLAINQAGIADQVRKAWLTAGDEVVRSTHQTAGVVYSEGIGMDDLFEVGNDSMLVPGGGSEAEENINCRCSPLYRRIRK